MIRIWQRWGLCLGILLVSATGLAGPAAGDLTVDAAGGSTAAFISPSGMMEDSGHRRLGQIHGSGEVVDAHNATVGWIRGDGTIEDAGHRRLGRFRHGSHRHLVLEHAGGSIRGYVDRTGFIENSGGSTVGRIHGPVIGSELAIAAYLYFFASWF